MILVAGFKNVSDGKAVISRLCLNNLKRQSKGSKFLVLNCYYMGSQKMLTFLMYFDLVIKANRIDEFHLFKDTL